MKPSKQKDAQRKIESAQEHGSNFASSVTVRNAEFDEKAMEKQVRIGHLRNMLLADAYRKDAIKQANVADKSVLKKKIRTAMVFTNEDDSLATISKADVYKSKHLALKHKQAEKVAVLDSTFAEQRRYAEGALEKLEMPDSPSYHLAENQVEFDPEHVAVPSRVDVHEGKKANKLISEIFSWVMTLFLAFVLAFVFVTFIAQRNIVDGSSMYPTLYNGDNLIVEKVSRYFSLPPYGTIITFIKPKLQVIYSEESDGKIKRDVKERPELPDTHLVKRVIGLPGDVIEIKDGKVYRNNSLLDEPYLNSQVVTNVEDPFFAKVTLAADELFVLGDNREHSSDSRYFGPIKVKSIVGRSLLRFYPFSRAGIPR